MCCSICVLATTIWSILHTELTLFSESFSFGGAFSLRWQRWDRGLLIAVCVAIATTTTASVAHVLWHLCFSRTDLLLAVSVGAYSLSCLITCLVLILCPAFIDTGSIFWEKPASKGTKYGSQILDVILCTNYWFFFHVAQANNNDIEVPFIREFLFFNSGLAALALLVHWPSSNTYENSEYLKFGLKED